MKYSVKSQRMAAQLLEIERAGRREAEARLADAAATLAAAEGARGEAQGALVKAEQDWAGHLAGRTFDPELGRALGVGLLGRETELGNAHERERGAAERADQERSAWRIVETRVRSGEMALRRARRALGKRSEEARGHALFEATTWKWFAR
jgi:hypothetical protein